MSAAIQRLQPLASLLLLVQTVRERDVVGAQLIRRNDELALLYEKIKIAEMTLYKGELQYTERLEDIRVLKLEIRYLRCTNKRLHKSNQVVEDLRFDERYIDSM